MVKLNRIYTKTGDDGTTGLVRGPRRAKYDLRVEAYGTVDEANASVGMARLHTSSMPKIDMLLARIQNDLFDVGSDLATPGADDPAAEYPTLRIRPVQTAFLEKQIDHYNRDIEPLKSFILPGGSLGSAYLHVARTVCRRAEREASTLAREEGVGPYVLSYLNRLSDALFVMARFENHQRNVPEPLWQPGK